jgi:hypothetical protein
LLLLLGKCSSATAAPPACVNPANLLMLLFQQRVLQL